MKRFSFTSSAKLLLGFVLSAASPSAASEAPVSRHHLTSAQYQNLAVNYHNSGYRLKNVSGYEVNGAARYAAIWVKENGPDLATHHGMTSNEYQDKATTYHQQGYRLIWVDGYNVGDQTLFAAIWEKKAGAPLAAHHNMTSSEYQNKFDAYKADGFRVVHVDGYRSGSSNHYAAIWVKDGGTFPRAHHDQTSASYQATAQQNVAQGYRPLHVSGWGRGHSAGFASLWVKQGGDPFWMRHDLNSQQYQAEAENFHFTGYHVKNVQGYTVNGQARFVAFWENPHMKASDLNLIENRIRNYMQDQDIPGLSLAIAKGGHLVYARGFGFADLETAELVSPTSRMRVASISKPITATAIMKLVDDGELSLEDAVFGPGAILGNQYGTPPYSSAVLAIRVKHLLWHCSGWSNEGDDPMFNGHSNHDAVIDWMLDNRDPLNMPEDNDEYLNFGYCVLGRVIEQITGLSYESYVKQAVLQPSGITGMEIGAKDKANKKAKESTYYDGTGPYTAIRPRHFDSHGGWIATATDLLRFKVRVDGSATKTDILSNEAYTAMMQSSPASSIRAMGWRYGNDGHGHNGCMSGTIGFLWDTDDGYTFAILANTRPEDDGCAWQARGLVEDILYDVSAWPEYDLFTGSHEHVAPIIVNPQLGGLVTDLVFKAPGVAPELPKFALIDLPEQDDALGRLTLEEGGPFELKRPVPTPQPEIAMKLTDSWRGGRSLSLSFATEEGWDYLVERSHDGQVWTAEPVSPGRDGLVNYEAPTTETAELFRVQVQPMSESNGSDPTFAPIQIEAKRLQPEPDPRPQPVGLLLPAVQAFAGDVTRGR